MTGKVRWFVGTIALVAAIIVSWTLYLYIAPETATDRKDFVQALSLSLGGIAGIVSLYLAWRNLKQSQENTQQTLLNTRRVEEQRAREATLQKYFEETGRLLVDSQLRESNSGDNVSIVVRAHTLTVLEGLDDPTRKRILLQFLYESDLIDKERPVVDLGRANLKEADLSQVNLASANLREANIGGADMRGAHLKGTDMRGANLTEANLSEANMTGASLGWADLSGADLSGADLSEADLTGANLLGTSLTNADLRGATLRGTDPTGADFTNANLSGADLIGTDFRGVKSMTQEQVEQTVGDRTTRLPSHLRPPEVWIDSSAVVFLSTDIENFATLRKNHPDQMDAALARYDEILRAAVEAYGGRVIRTVGDAYYATFGTVKQALEATLVAQRTFFAEPWDEGTEVRVRMALQAGVAEEREGYYFGPPVNQVARLLSAAHGGQILLSAGVYGLGRDDLGHLEPGTELRDLSEHGLKDIEHTEPIYQLVVPDLPSALPFPKTYGSDTSKAKSVMESVSQLDPANPLGRRYSRIRTIGSGGMAKVYLARDNVLDRDVALKALHTQFAGDEGFFERFKTEAKSAASLLSHPNIVQVFDAGEGEFEGHKVPYIVMEYVSGGTLKERMRREGTLPPFEAARLTLQVARALEAAHRRGVIHRDIKPQNILLTESGEAKVADFGIVMIEHSSDITRSGALLGSPHYMSPEQAMGEPAGFRSDLYALGVVLYQLLTGKLPYDADSPMGIAMKHITGQLRLPKEVNPNVPEGINAITAQLLAKDPNERYPDAAALITDLEQARDDSEWVSQFKERNSSEGQ